MDQEIIDKIKKYLDYGILTAFDKMQEDDKVFKLMIIPTWEEE